MENDENLMRLLAKNLNKLVENKRMNQSDIARGLGVSRARLNSWLKGKAIPRADALDAIAKYFGVSRSNLFEADEQATTNELSLKIALFGTYDVSDELLEQVKAYAKFLMEQSK